MAILSPDTQYCHLVDRDNSDNLIVPGTLTVAGVPVGGGGGGGFSDLIQVNDDGNSTPLVNGVPAFLVFDPTLNDGAQYRINGTAFSVVAGKIVVATTGWYDVDTSLVLGGGAAANAYCIILFAINGAPTTHTLPAHTVIPMNAPAVAVQARLRRINLTAGDTIEVATVNSGDDATLQTSLTVAVRVA